MNLVLQALVNDRYVFATIVENRLFSNPMLELIACATFLALVPLGLAILKAVVE